MIRTVLLTAALAVGITAAVAQSNPIAERRDLMKGVGAATRTATQMSRGEIPFDLAKAREVLQDLRERRRQDAHLFPGDQQDRRGDDRQPQDLGIAGRVPRQIRRLGEGHRKAKTETKDLATFKANFETLSKACGSCHQSYRIQKS
jgi:cytochrome c556